MQGDEKWHEFSQRMTFEGSLHIGVDPLEGVADASAIYSERNLNVLRALALLDERRVENSDDDNPLLQELARMDTKINLLLEIVDRFLIPASALPSRHPIRFNAVGLVMPQSLLPPTPFLLARLHFDACRALPLELPAQPMQRFDDATVFVTFCTLNESIENALERLVFRHHRRKVAEARLSVT